MESFFVRMAVREVRLCTNETQEMKRLHMEELLIHGQLMMSARCHPGI